MSVPNAPGIDSIWQRPTTPPSVLHAGRLLGRYQVETRLPGGAMGEVWKAFDPVRKRHVVIKLLPLILQGNAIEVKRIEESFYKVEQLNHENICPVYDLGKDEQVGYYLVMNFVDGVTLAVHRHTEQRAGRPIRPIAVLQLLKPIAVALDYLHQHGIVHRDIKPQNIMIQSQDQKPLLVDFGLAEEIRSSISRMSRMTIDVSGTYPYMSPEQWKAQPQDGRTDQYALAVVLYEMIAGRLPFESSDPQIMRMCAINDAPPMIEWIPPTANQVLERGLAKLARDRFPSCIGMIEAFESACARSDDRPTSVLVSGAVSRVWASVSTSRFFGMADAAKSKQPTQSHSALVTIALVLVVLFFGWMNRSLWFGPDPNSTSGTNGSTAGALALSASASNPANAVPTAPSPPQAVPLANPVTSNPVPTPGPSPTLVAANAPSTPTNVNAAPVVPGPASTVVVASSQSSQPDKKLIHSTEQAQSLANRAHYDAKNSNASEYARTEWEKAEQLLSQANVDFSKARFSEALSQYENASRTYYEAINIARKARAIAENLKSELNELGNLRNAAISAQAERLARPEYDAACASEETMKKLLQDRNYPEMAEKMVNAKAGYRLAQQVAERAAKVEALKANFDAIVRTIDKDMLKTYGGKDWQEKVERIAAAKNASEQEAGYLAAIAVLPGIQQQVRSHEIDGMISRKEHEKVLNMLWPEFKQLDSIQRKAFYQSAANAPKWWLEQAVAEVGSGSFDEHSKAMLLVALALPGAALGVDPSNYSDQAIRLSDQIANPQESMEATFEIAKEFPKGRDIKTLLEVITEVNVDVDALDPAARQPQNEINQWLKCYIPLRCAALLWRAGDKEKADAYSKMAFVSESSTSNFYYNLPAYQAMLVYSEANDLKNLNGLQQIRNGELDLNSLQGSRPYQSLMSIRVGRTQDLNNGASNNSSYSVLAHAFIAAAAAKMQDRGLFQVHYRRSSEGVKEMYVYSALQKLQASTIHARLAIAEARDNDFVAANGRIKNFVKHPLAMGEAMLELGRCQLASSVDVKARGIAGAISTLNNFGSHPCAAILAREIALKTATQDFSAAVDWCNALTDPRHRIGAMSGIAYSTGSSSRAKRDDLNGK
jgi:eukaryotic-like serine/threonine-protein kinase